MANCVELVIVFVFLGHVLGKEVKMTHEDSLLKNVSSKGDDVHLYLYTAKGKIHDLNKYKGNLVDSPLKSETETYIIIDGFVSNHSSAMCQTTKNTLLKMKPDANVIIVDWSKLNGNDVFNGNILLWGILYAQAVQNIAVVAKEIVKFLIKLDSQLHLHSPDWHIQLLGFDLGSHIAGIAGYEANAIHDLQITCITGFDPAGPLFDTQPDDTKRLSNEDAIFVETYQSSSDLGISGVESGLVQVFFSHNGEAAGCDHANGSGIEALMCRHDYSWKIWNKCTLFGDCYACPCHEMDKDCLNCSTECHACEEGKIRVGLDLAFIGAGEKHGGNFHYKHVGKD